jgi:cell division protein ZapA
MGQVAIEVNGKVYRFVCGDGEEARITALGTFVSDKVAELSRLHGRTGDEKMLVMVAVMIADELFEARKSLPAGSAKDPETGKSRKSNPS